ncbi:phosphatidylinositol transfer protein sfh5 [Aspergillus ambiguus]|uniref:CRAL/TRIO domain protein n=1 Tax=Aspergillus ambiguus TaxID=176160 RepID=UPI003CCD1A59
MSDQKDVSEPQPPVNNPTESPAQPEKPAEPTPDGSADANGKTEEPAPQSTSAEAPAEQPQQGDQQKDSPADNKPEYLAKNPALSQFFDRLPTILSNAGHDEMWGVALKDSSDVPTVNVMIKLLRANEGNVTLAEEQLTKALKWRKEMDPTALVETASYSASKFGGLGYLTTYKDANGKETVVTWNIYGSVKSIDATFGDMDEFVKWRVALMEMAVKELKMDQATAVMDYNAEEDPYQMIQVHDYLNVSFLRLNPNLRAATKKTIEVFAMAYPELLREKFFVNVPAIMGWMFAAMKVFLSKNTTRKFHPISNGANLAREFPAPLKELFPKAYGGNGAALQDDARTVKLVADPEPAAETKGDAKAEDAPDTSKEEPKQESADPAREKTDAEVKENPAAATEAK